MLCLLLVRALIATSSAKTRRWHTSRGVLTLPGPSSRAPLPPPEVTLSLLWPSPHPCPRAQVPKQQPLWRDQAYRPGEKNLGTNCGSISAQFSLQHALPLPEDRIARPSLAARGRYLLLGVDRRRRPDVVVEAPARARAPIPMDLVKPLALRPHPTTSAQILLDGGQGEGGSTSGKGGRG